MIVVHKIASHHGMQEISPSEISPRAPFFCFHFQIQTQRANVWEANRIKKAHSSSSSNTRFVILLDIMRWKFRTCLFSALKSKQITDENCIGASLSGISVVLSPLPGRKLGARRCASPLSDQFAMKVWRDIGGWAALEGWMLSFCCPNLVIESGVERSFVFRWGGNANSMQCKASVYGVA